MSFEASTYGNGVYERDLVHDLVEKRVWRRRYDQINAFERMLVDEGTARAAEILAGALHDQSRSILLGDKTFGLCGLTQVLPLQDGSALLMTVANCFTPGGRKISGEGLKPDVEGKKPPETLERLTSPAPEPDKDPWVQQAVEVLKKGNFSRLVKQNSES